MIRPILYASTVMAALLAAAATASAAPIVFSGNSNGSTLNGVTGAATINGNNTLNTTPNVNFNGTMPPATGVELAALTMTFNARPSTTSTGVTYDLVLTITKPTSATFDLPVLSLTAAYDGTSMFTVSGFAFPSSVILPGNIVLSDFTFTTSVANDNSATGPSSASFDTTTDTWTISNSTTHGTAQLDIFADVSVPEPASLAIFGAALAGFGLLRRRRKNG